MILQLKQRLSEKYENYENDYINAEIAENVKTIQKVYLYSTMLNGAVDKSNSLNIYDMIFAKAFIISDEVNIFDTNKEMRRKNYEQSKNVLGV